MHFKSRIFKIEKEKLQVKLPTKFDVPKSIQIIIIIIIFWVTHKFS